MKNAVIAAIIRIGAQLETSINICAVGKIHMEKWETGILPRTEHAEHGISGTMENMLKLVQPPPESVVKLW